MESLEDKMRIIESWSSCLERKVAILRNLSYKEKVEFAKKTKDIDLLWEMSLHRRYKLPEIDAAIVRNPNTPEEILFNEFVTCKEEWSVIIGIAKNPQLSRRIFKELLRTCSDYYQESKIRWVAGHNPYVKDKFFKLYVLPHKELVEFAKKTEDTDVLWDMIKSKGCFSSPEVQVAIYKNPNVPKEIQYIQTNMHSWAHTGIKFRENVGEEAYCALRNAAARDKNTPKNILDYLAGAYEPDVRLGVAKNINTPGETLKYLSDDKNTEVRRAVARNQNTPKETLEKLAGDVFEVVKAVAKNPSTPKEILSKLGDHCYFKTRCAVARNPNTPKETLLKLSEDQNFDVRCNLFKNKCVLGDEEILIRLTQDKYEDIRKKASRRLNCLRKAIRAMNTATANTELDSAQKTLIIRAKSTATANPEATPARKTLIIREMNITTVNVYSENYVNPPIPKGYKHVCGEWNNGFVIERSSDISQFVWIPVGSLDSDGTLDGEHFSEKFGRRNYRNNDFSDHNYHEKLDGELLEQLESVKKYGGFYISRYNISKSSEGKPQSVKGVMPWININFYDAKKVSSTIEDMGALKSHLTFGAEYDSVLEWFIKSEAKTLAEIVKDSTKWGNYYNTKHSPLKVVETGSREEWCTNNIYDFAGNVEEWTQEMNSSWFHVVRGSNYYDDGFVLPVAFRNYYGPCNSCKYTGFRATLWIK